jgi:hypothetical protein
MTKKEEFALLCREYFKGKDCKLDKLNSTKLQPYYFWKNKADNVFEYVLFDLDKNGIFYDIEFYTSPYIKIRKTIHIDHAETPLFSYFEITYPDKKSKMSYANLLRIGEETEFSTKDYFEYFKYAYETCKTDIFDKNLKDLKKKRNNYRVNLETMNRIWEKYQEIGEQPFEDFISSNTAFYMDSFEFFRKDNPLDIELGLQTFNRQFYTKAFASKLKDDYESMRKFVFYAIPEIYKHFEDFCYPHYKNDKFDTVHLTKFQSTAVAYFAEKRLFSK